MRAWHNQKTGIPNTRSSQSSQHLGERLERLLGMKMVRSRGVGRQNCCDGVTQSGWVFALTFTFVDRLIAQSKQPSETATLCVASTTMTRVMIDSATVPLRRQSHSHTTSTHKRQYQGHQWETVGVFWARCYSLGLPLESECRAAEDAETTRQNPTILEPLLQPAALATA